MTKEMIDALKTSRFWVLEDMVWFDMTHQLMLTKSGRLWELTYKGDYTFHCQVLSLDELKEQYFLLTKKDL